MVFHSPQPGQRPIHLGEVVPQLEQIKIFLIFDKGCNFFVGNFWMNKKYDLLLRNKCYRRFGASFSNFFSKNIKFFEKKYTRKSDLFRVAQS
jgi:hypothetical protein